MKDDSMLSHGEVVFTVLIAAFVLCILVSFIIVFILFYQRRRSAYIQELMSVKAEYQETLLRSQLEIREQTLQHIAAELHDNVGQIASLIKINLSTLQATQGESRERKIDEIKELVKQLIGDLKAMSQSLNADRVVQLGIVKAIETEVERLNKTGQFAATLTVDEEIPPLDGNTTTILFRMVQEIINNMVKHSHGKQLSIAFTKSEKSIILVCTDDGVGFTVEEKLKSGGSGLMNLQRRSKQLGSTFSIDSAPAKGTTITIELPT